MQISLQTILRIAILYSFGADEVGVFLYPDMKTALVGQFEENIMIIGKEARVVAERCNDGIKEIQLSKVESDAPTFKYRAPGKTFIGDQPTKMDPYEKRFVYIGNSVLGDDGLFARKDIKAKELFSYYSGIFRPDMRDCDMRISSTNQTGYEL